MMIIYFDIYDINGKWCGMADSEYIADRLAFENSGYYVERHETIEL